MGQKVYLIQAKKISFVETGKNTEYSIWGARTMVLTFGARWLCCSDMPKAGFV